MNGIHDCSECGAKIVGMWCMNTDCPKNQKASVLAPRKSFSDKSISDEESLETKRGFF